MTNSLPCRIDAIVQAIESAQDGCPAWVYQELEAMVIQLESMAAVFEGLECRPRHDDPREIAQ
jgi:hypothetical protein